MARQWALGLRSAAGSANAKKIESGKIELNLEPVLCQGAIYEIATALSPLAEAKGIALDIVVPEHAVIARVDRRALQQILFNLVGNAIKFTERGHVRIELGQRGAGEDQRVEVRVIDTGIGIRPEDQAKLFQAFTQLDATATRRHEGTGLGLHLSRKLAWLLGGQIAVQSEYGAGSIFTLSIVGDHDQSNPMQSAAGAA